MTVTVIVRAESYWGLLTLYKRALLMLNVGLITWLPSPSNRFFSLAFFFILWLTLNSCSSKNIHLVFFGFLSDILPLRNPLPEYFSVYYYTYLYIIPWRISCVDLDILLLPMFLAFFCFPWAMVTLFVTLPGFILLSAYRKPFVFCWFWSILRYSHCIYSLEKVRKEK